jgi:trimethylamine:corrinoid methyltransferase-like protein
MQFGLSQWRKKVMWNKFKSAARFGAECAVTVVGVIGGLCSVVFAAAFGVTVAMHLLGIAQ